MLSNSEMKKLLHDMKRLGKAIQIIIDEEEAGKRELIGGLLRDEIDRLYEDLEELKEHNNGEIIQEDKNKTILIKAQEDEFDERLNSYEDEEHCGDN